MPCYQALADDPRFTTIREKVALGPDRSSGSQHMAKLSERASEQERSAIAEWRKAREECHRLEKPYYATRDTEIQSIALKHFAAVQTLIGELRDGKLTYGEFDARRVALYDKVNRDIDEVRKRILPPKPASPMPTK